MSSQIDWSAFNSGPTWDGDIIKATIEQCDPSVVPANTVEFVLEAGSHIDWWKAIRVPDGLGSSWEIWTQDSTTSGRVPLWADQVLNGQSLEFKKAKSFGIHTGMYLLGGLERLSGGSRVTFRWVQDKFPDYNGWVVTRSLSLEFVEGTGFWAVPGQPFSITLRVNNNSSEWFTIDAGYRIGSWPQDNMIWGRNRVDLPEDVPIENIFGGAGDVTFTLTAPTTPGRYPLSWRLVQEGVTWFGTPSGPKPDGRILVSATRPTPVPPPTTTVPSIVGMIASQALVALTAAQLQVGTVGNVTGILDFDVLRVTGQTPPAGSVVSPGTRVDFGVALAVGPIPM